MEIFRFFISIWPILLILRISTGQPIKKEQSVHEAFIGCIIEQIEGSNSAYTESDSHKNSWIYLCFSFPFLRFCWFWGFQLPALQGGAVCSWRLYGMNYRADRGLESRLHRTRFAQELMEIFRFFISLSLILLILRISTGQPIKKERSVHEACMVCIMQGFERFNSVQTESNSPKNSRR